jgi:hypothetical protein
MREASRSGSISDSNPGNGAINTPASEHESPMPPMADISPRSHGEKKTHIITAPGGSLSEPLLGDQGEPSSDHAIDIQGDATAQAFVTDIHARVKLPNKISWSHLPGAVFATATTAAGSFLYALGGKQLGIKYEVGGIGINIPQNIYYGLGTAEFFSESYKNFKNVWGRCLAATTLGVAATVPSAVASWKLSDGGWFGYVQTGLTFFGNLPNNIYGMYDAIKRPLDYKNDNPRVRAFLTEKYRQSLPEEYRNILSDADRSIVTTVASYALGFSLGTGLMAAQTGYMCSSSRFLAEVVKNEGAGVALGVLANSPTLLIAFLISGFDLAKDSVELTADIYRHLTGDKSVPLTEGDKKQYAAFATIFAGCAYMAYYSSATSQLLYDGNCPSFGNPLSAILRESSVDGAAVFNQIMTSKAFLKLLSHLKMAYDNNDESRSIYRVRMTDMYLKATGSREDLEEIARTHYPEQIAEWQKVAPVAPATEPAEKTSYFSSVSGFFSRKKPGTGAPPAPPTEVNTSNAAASFLNRFGYGKQAPKTDTTHGQAAPAVLTATALSM